MSIKRFRVKTAAVAALALLSVGGMAAAAFGLVPASAGRAPPPSRAPKTPPPASRPVERPDQGDGQGGPPTTS